jgi:hypothetical protein
VNRGITGWEETALHEMAHHFVPPDLYPDVAAFRHADDNGNTIIDNNHARTRDNDYVGNIEPDDRPGLVSTLFSISNDSYKTVTKVNSTLSQGRDPKAPDAKLYNKLVEGFYPRPPDKVEPVDDVISVLSLLIDTDEGIEIHNVRTKQGRPSPGTDSGRLSVRAISKDGILVSERLFPTSIQEGMSSKSPQSLDPVNIVTAVIEFPKSVVKIRVVRDSGEETDFNPITRTLRSLFQEIPDSAFIRDADGARESLANQLDTVARHIDADRYRPALNVTRGIRTTLQHSLQERYEINAADEPTKQEVLRAVNDRINRLETLAGR